MKRLIVLIVLSMVCGCASQPVYKEMRTIESAVKEDHIKPGMAITKSGAVVHIDVEEVQAREKRLIAEKSELEQALKNMKEEKDKIEDRYKAMRIFVGLAPYEPKPKGECCDAKGNVMNFTPAPTLNEELAALKREQDTAE